MAGELRDFIAALNSSADTVNKSVDSYFKAQADFDLTNMQIKLQDEAQAKLQEMQKNNKYQTWEQEIDNFFTEKLSSLDNEDSNYYCRNSYTAVRAQQMLANERTRYQDKVFQMAQSKIKELNIQKYIEDKQTVNNIYSGQEQIDINNTAAKALSETGALSPEQLGSELITNYSNGIYSTYTNNFTDDLIKASAAAGKDFTEVWEDYTKNIQDPIFTGIDGTEKKIDMTKQKDNAKNVCKGKYEAAVIGMQKNNYANMESKLTQGQGMLAQLYTGETSDIIPLETLVLNAQKELMQLGGKQLAQGQQKQLSNEFNNLLQQLRAFQKQATSGSGSNSVESYAAFVSELPDNFMGYIKDGTYDNYYQLRDGLTLALQEKFYDKPIWKETQHLQTEEQKEQWWIDNYENLAINKILNSKVLNEKLNNDFPEIKAKWEILKKDIEKDLKLPEKKRKYSAGSMNLISDFIMDTMAASGANTDKTEVSKQLDKIANACVLSGLQGMFNKRKWNESNMEYLSRTAKELEDNDVVFTDLYGKERWIEGSKEKVSKIAEDQRNYIQETLGVELYDGTTTKVENDVTPVHEFMIKSDDKKNSVYLHIESDGKKNVKIVDRNGKEYTGANINDFKTEDKIVKKQNAADIKEAHADTLAKENSSHEKTNEMITRNTEASDLIKDVGNITEEQWKSSAGNVTERQILLTDTVSKIDKLTKKLSHDEFMDKVGISIEEWNAKGNIAKYEYLINK